MPIFEFKCSQCGEEFDHFFLSSDETEANCPKCNKSHGLNQRVEMSVNTFHLRFKNLPV